MVTYRQPSQLKTFQKQMKRVSIWIGMNTYPTKDFCWWRPDYILNRGKDYMHFHWLLDISGNTQAYKLHFELYLTFEVGVWLHGPRLAFNISVNKHSISSRGLIILNTSKLKLLLGSKNI